MMQQQLRADRPQDRAGAVGPPQQGDAVLRRPSLLYQPLPRRQDIGDPFAAGSDPALLDMALRAKFARTITIRKQNRLAVLEQFLRPVPIANLNRFGMAGQPAASMQRDHDRKRAIAFRFKKLCAEHGCPGRNLDGLRCRQRRCLRRQRHSQECENNGDQKTHGFAGSGARAAVRRSASSSHHSSAADLKFLHPKRRIRSRNFK